MAPPHARRRGGRTPAQRRVSRLRPRGAAAGVRRERMSARGVETREKIRAVALALFQEKGFDGATMREVALKAGVATGAAYYYFPSKEALVLEFYARLQDEMEQNLPAALEGRRDLGERLRALLDLKFGLLRPNRRFFGALVRAGLDPENPVSPFSTETAALRDRSIAIFRRALEGSDVRIPADLGPHLPRLLWLYYMGLILFWLLDRSEGQKRTGPPHRAQPRRRSSRPSSSPASGSRHPFERPCSGSSPTSKEIPHERSPGGLDEPRNRRLPMTWDEVDERRRIKPAQWALAGIIVALTASGIAYRLLVLHRLEQTSALFIGLPALLALVLALTPRAKSVTGIVMKGTTIALLLSAPILGEGFVCILMAAPIFYLIAFIVALRRPEDPGQSRPGPGRHARPSLRPSPPDESRGDPSVSVVLAGGIGHRRARRRRPPRGRREDAGGAAAFRGAPSDVPATRLPEAGRSPRRRTRQRRRARGAFRRRRRPAGRSPAARRRARPRPRRLPRRLGRDEAGPLARSRLLRGPVPRGCAGEDRGTLDHPLRPAPRSAPGISARGRGTP